MCPTPHAQVRMPRQLAAQWREREDDLTIGESSVTFEICADQVEDLIREVRP